MSVAARYPILIGWIAVTVAATAYLPALAPAGTLTGLVPKGLPAVRAEAMATRLFGLPLTSQVDVVQYDPSGFPGSVQDQAARQALAYDQRKVPRIPGLVGALPASDTALRAIARPGRSASPSSSALPALPGRRPKAIVTFLYLRPGTPVGQQTLAGDIYARRFLRAPGDHLAGVTGIAPAESAQTNVILHYLPLVELATVLAILLIVGLYFRSPTAPLATLLCAVVAYLVASRGVAWGVRRAGTPVPPDLEPVLVVLLLGVTTDYSVFFLAGMRNRLAEGLGRVAAARRTTAEFAPIIVAAGLVVAAGIVSLSLAGFGPLHEFGLVLAATVAVAMVVAVTLSPALIAIFGRVLFLPGPRWFRRAIRPAGRRAARLAAGPTVSGPTVSGPTVSGPTVSRPAADGEAGATSAAGVRSWRDAVTRRATSRGVALLIGAVCVAGLLIGALPLRHIRLGYPVIRALPPTSRVLSADYAATRAFPAGVLAPTDVIVLAPGISAERPALDRLQHLLARQPGVAAVIGPGSTSGQRRLSYVMVSRSGNAARYGVIEGTEPLAPTAIARIRALRRHLPALARDSGLSHVRFVVGGETAFAGETIHATDAGLGSMAIALAAVIFLLLVIFLRSLLAPIYLLAASVLALLSALGLTVLIFQRGLGYPGLVYYVPFAVGVLLVSLGSDYNVFVVGRIWEEARRLPLREAVVAAVPRASRAITTAGLALAAGFGLLALVPLEQFREIAVAMVLGIVIDTFVVRSLLVPAMVVLFGRPGMWPSGTLVRRRAARRDPRDPARRDPARRDPARREAAHQEYASPDSVS
ncbi:MAG: MMPL family transporter [Streptosporangiaceae bacterium]